MESKFGILEVRQRIGDALAFAGRTFFPHRCLHCGLEGKSLCHACFAAVAAPLAGVFFCPGCGEEASADRCGKAACRSVPLAGAVAMAPYAEPTLRGLLHEYKYEGVVEAGEVLAGMFRLFLERHRAFVAARYAGATVVPVPIHPWRKALRGYDQCESFAVQLARAAGGRMRTDVLRRAFRLRTQAHIDDREARLANARGSVRSVPGVRVSGTVVLVDDVFTTGATLGACASELRRIGAAEVHALALMKG